MSEPQATASTPAEAREQMIAVIVHHLRNRLSRVLFSAEAVSRGAAQVPALAAVAGRLRRGIDELITSFDQLFELARVLDEHAQPRLEEVDLVALVRESVEAARPQFASLQHELNVQVPAEPVWAAVDRVDLELAIANLLSNAAKFTPQGGRIQVSLEIEGGNFELIVADNGIGIEPAMLPHLFDGFVGAHAPGVSRGLKAGLLVVRRVAELHGGTVEAHSAGPDRGTEITLRIPLRAAAVVDPDVPRALLVDSGAGSSAPLLRSWGYHVRRIEDAAVAAASARDWTPSLVVVAARGAAEDAGLAAALRGAAPDAKLVLVGGGAAGYDATVPEDYDAERLQAAVIGASRPA